MGQATAVQQHAKERMPSQPQHQSSGHVHHHITKDNKPVLAGIDSVEMIPLGNSLLDQQTTKSFHRLASPVYTPTPPRETWPFKKTVVESSPMAKQGRGQTASSKRGELKDCALWSSNVENMPHNEQDLYVEEIPMHQTNRSSSVENVQLRTKVRQLEQKLYDKECQLQVAEKNAQQIHLQLNTTVEMLQSQIQQKDHAIQTVEDQLFKKQLEVVSLQSLVKKSEVNVQASSMKAASLEEELDGLRCEVGTLLFLAQQSQLTSFQEEPLVEGPITPATTSCDMPSMVDMLVGDVSASQLPDIEEQHTEVIRRKYVAAINAAREDPTEEMLSLAADLRMQLQALVMCPPMMATTATSTMNDVLCMQTLGLSIC